MHHQTTPTTIALILATCLLLTGCSAETLQKNEFRQDPLYTATWDGIESLSTEESTNGGWKPPPTIHHPLLENNTPPRRSSTKNHDNRQTRKLKRRRTSLHTSNHQMGAQRKNAAVHLSKDANQMQTIPGNKPGNNLHHRHQLTTAHPKSPASTKDAKQSSTAFLTLPGQGTVNLRICLLFAPPAGQSL